jgi:hypothetical protein
VLGLFIPLVGTPYFEHVDDAKRGYSLQFAPVIRDRYEARIALDDKAWHLKLRTFEWRSRFARKDNSDIFDVWEEV